MIESVSSSQETVLAYNEKDFEHPHKCIEKCEDSNVRVIKTIRLHHVNLITWILDSDIKIVHLVRDPRAMINSLLKGPKTWKRLSENIDGMCKKMITDTTLKDLLPKNR